MEEDKNTPIEDREPVDYGAEIDDLKNRLAEAESRADQMTAELKEAKATLSALINGQRAAAPDEIMASINAKIRRF